MAQSRWLAIFSVLCVSCCLTRGASAAKKAEKADPARDAVEEVLQREAGSRIDRREELAGTLLQQPDSNLARWQSGYVRDGAAWRSFSDVRQPTAADAEQLERYRTRREKTAQTAAAQLELANWCHQNGLPAQERAHLYSAARLDSAGEQNESISRRLGYQPVGNQWLTSAQLDEWKDRNRLAAAAISKHGPKLERITGNLSGTRSQREHALASLKQMAEPKFIPAMEYTICGQDTATALIALELFSQMPEYEATLALAKQAAFSEWTTVRREASNFLKSRPLEEFVPTFIGLLATPLKSKSESRVQFYLRDDQGAVVLLSSYVLSRETENQFQVAVLNTVDHRLTEYLRQAGASVHVVNRTNTVSFHWPANRGGLLAVAGEKWRFQNDFGREQAADAHQRQKQVDAVNDRTEQLNGRIVQVLATVSGREPTSDVNAWWQWWDGFTDTQLVGGKKVITVREDEIRGDPAAGLYVTRSSCFAAGTPVWTARGLQPIESIKAGDSVLSQDVDTGELAYKTILFTSVRPPRELVRVQFSDETISATGGHRFWVSGGGWVKSRDIKPRSLVHTVTANTPVIAVGTGPVESTYNLVVDEFHTYFVGRQALLVQDLPMPRPTNSAVPGLPRRQIAVVQQP